MPFYIQSYNSRQELNRAHPEAINFKCFYQKPRGMNDETAIRINVIRALERRNITQQPVYQVGDFFWIPAESTTQKTPKPLCRCLQHIGDNGPCPEHGPGLSQEPVQ